MGGMPVTASWDQDSFRWYTDAGGEGTNPLADTNVDPTTIEPGDQVRLRYLIQETAGSNQSETPVLWLEYRVDPAGGTSFGSWANVDTDEIYFDALGTSGVTDHATTTQQIGAGTFNDGEFVYTNTGTSTTNSLAATAGNDEYEIEWVIHFDTTNSDGANFEFRVVEFAGALTTYTRTTQVLLTAPAVSATWDQDSFRWYTDEGGEGTNPKAATNVNPTDLEYGTKYRLRILMQETAGSNQSEAPIMRLRYRDDPAGGTSFGSWFPVRDSDNRFATVSTSSVTDHGSTTQQIGAGTFRDGEFIWTEVGTGNSDTNSLAATQGNDEYESEWVFEFTSFADGHNFEFRIDIYDGAWGQADTYTQTTQVLVGPPTITGTGAATLPALTASGQGYEGRHFEMNITTVSASEVFTIPCSNHGTFDAIIDWGDGNTSTITAWDDADLAHTYTTAGTYDIKILGRFGNIYFNNTGTSKDRVNTVKMGDVDWARMNSAFEGCGNLTSVDFTDYGTSQTVTDFSSMFNACGSLATLTNFANFDVSSATTLYQLFRNCSSLTSIDCTNWDSMPSCASYRFTFSGCSSVTTITGVADIDVSAATSLEWMFQNTGLTSLDLSSWTTTASLTDMSYFCSQCDDLASVTFGSGWNTTGVTDMYRMFYSISNTDLTFTGLDNLDVDSLASGAATGMDDWHTANKFDTASYDALLIKMDSGTPPSNITADFLNTRYSKGGAAETARTSLINDHGWTITDGGSIVTGTGAPTLPALEASGSGIIEKTGSGAATLPAITASGSGNVVSTHTGTGAITLTVIEASGAGEVEKTGSGASDLPVITASGSGVIGRDGSGAPVLGALTASGAGAVVKTGTGAVDLPAISASGSGVVKIAGSGAVDLPMLTASGSGEVSVNGTGSATLPKITSAGMGLRVLPTNIVDQRDGNHIVNRDSSAVLLRDNADVTYGTASLLLPMITVFGSAGTTHTGSGAATLPAITASGVGEIEKTGSGGVDLPAITASGSGTVAIAGTGAVTLPAITASGVGEIEKTGSGASTLPAITTTGAGTMGRSGSGSLDLPVVTASGSGAVGRYGSGAILLPVPTLSGAGTVIKTGAGTVTLPALAASGVGEIEKTGTGSATLPAVEADASGTVVIDPTWQVNQRDTEIIYNRDGTYVKLRVITDFGSISLPVFLASGSGVRTSNSLSANATLPLLQASGNDKSALRRVDLYGNFSSRNEAVLVHDGTNEADAVESKNLVFTAASDNEALLSNSGENDTGLEPSKNRSDLVPFD